MDERGTVPANNKYEELDLGKADKEEGQTTEA